MQWFRLYNEFAFDPKVQSMDETSQRRLVMLLCLRCDDSIKKLSHSEIAFALRISDDELKDTKDLFIKKGFIDEEWNILNWDKRQYKSDSSADRTRAWRERKKHEKLKKSQNCHRDVTVTPPDTDTDTDNKPPYPLKNDQVESKTKYPDQFTQLWLLFPKKVGKPASYDKWVKIIKTGKASALELTAALKKQIDNGHFNYNEKFCPPNPLTWLNQGRWEDDVQIIVKTNVEPKPYEKKFAN